MVGAISSEGCLVECLFYRRLLGNSTDRILHEQDHPNIHALWVIPYRLGANTITDDKDHEGTIIANKPTTSTRLRSQQYKAQDN